MPAIPPAEKAVIKFVAKQIATAYFGPVGGFAADAFADLAVDYINAADADARYRAEVLTRLENIENKLDELREFVVKALPGIIYQQALDANLAVVKNDLLGLRASAEIALQRVKANPEDAGLRKDLDEQANFVLQKGFALGLMGLPMLAPVLATVTLGLLCYAALMDAAKNDDEASSYRITLRGWGDKFRMLADTWSGPLPLVIKESEAVLENAIHMVSSSPTPDKGVPFFLLQYNPNPQILQDAQFTNLKHYEWTAVVAYIDRMLIPGRWTGNHDRRTKLTLPLWDPYPGGPLGAAEIAAVKLPHDLTRGVMAGSEPPQYPLLLDWAPPITSAAEISTWFNEVCARWSDARAAVVEVPVRIASAKALLMAVTNMQEACRALSTLKAGLL